jgi:hypothetical protein
MRDLLRTASRSRLLWTGGILLVIGLSLTLLVGEWFSTWGACVAKPPAPASASAGLREQRIPHQPRRMGYERTPRWSTLPRGGAADHSIGGSGTKS